MKTKTNKLQKSIMNRVEANWKSQLPKGKENDLDSLLDLLQLKLAARRELNQINTTTNFTHCVIDPRD